jgi:hypothetical protein
MSSGIPGLGVCEDEQTSSILQLLILLLKPTFTVLDMGGLMKSWSGLS